MITHLSLWPCPTGWCDCSLRGQLAWQAQCGQDSTEAWSKCGCTD